MHSEIPAFSRRMSNAAGTSAISVQAGNKHFGAIRAADYGSEQSLTTSERNSTENARAWRFRSVAQSERPHIEQFIRCAFLSAYSARIEEFMPHLAALYRGSEIMAACGLRYAAKEKLYLETYLDQPIERVLEAIAGLPENRDGIVEVGNLAIARPGAARHFIAHLTDYLADCGHSRVVFTAVPALRNNFARLRIPIDTLGPARPDRLQPEARRAWGRYYDNAPQVTSVRVADAAAALAAIQ
jgi:hypothetical protein